MREKRILNSIDHLSIVKLYQTFQDKKCVYFLYELVERGTLAHLMKKFENDIFPKELAVFYIAEIIETLEFLHMQGILHRDIKP